MARLPPTSMIPLLQRHPFILFCPSFRSILTLSRISPVIRCDYVTLSKKRRRKIEERKTLKRREAEWQRLYQQPGRACSGCGISLQDDDPNEPGYVYKPKDAHKDRLKALKLKISRSELLFNAVLRRLDPETRKKLMNMEPKGQTFEELQKIHLQREKELQKEREKPFQPEEPISEEHASQHDAATVDEMYMQEDPDFSLPPRNPKMTRANLCRRCHEITYHSNPLVAIRQKLPTAKPIEQVMKEIRATNTDPANPPLLVHVIDVVDFPLSFVPSDVPQGSKVIFVINRCDSVCERSRSMAHVRAYFRRTLPHVLKDAGMNIENYDIHPVSAKKGYGMKELVARVFQLRNAQSNVYFIGHTNVGKSSVIAAMVHASGITKDPKVRSKYMNVIPTVSVFPHTTVGNVKIALNVFRPRGELRTDANLFDTPGVVGDSAYLNSFIDHEYSRAVSLVKVGGFQRPPDTMTANRSMVLGGLVRIDLLECVGHPSTPESNHIRITPYTNLPIHITSPEKADLIFKAPPSSFWSRKSTIEVVTTKAVGDVIKPSLELEVKSTGNSQRNTIEIVLAGLGFVAIGGNFSSAKLRVWTPSGRGVGFRKPIVEIIGKGYSLDIVKRKKYGRMIMLGRKSIGAVVPEEFEYALTKNVYPQKTLTANAYPEKVSMKKEKGNMVQNADGLST